MKNIMTSTSFRFAWFSFVFLLLFSLTEANEEWQHNDVEQEFYDIPSSDFHISEADTNKWINNELYDLHEVEDIDLYFKLQHIKQIKQRRFSTSIFSERAKPHIIPADHPAKEALDLIFSQPRVTKDINTLAAVGFITVSIRPFSFAIVAKHPYLPGYLQKLYLDTEQRKKNGKEGWEWLIQRCEGAGNIRKLIKKKALKYFSVPDKWIYIIPETSRKSKGQPCILLVTDMDLVSQEESVAAWKSVITKEHLNELYIILSNGFASSHVGWNIPYSKSGKFACIDTEYPKRAPNYQEVESYLSDEMKAYWQQLVRNRGKQITNPH